MSSETESNPENYIRLSEGQSIHYDGRHYDLIYEEFLPEVGDDDIKFFYDLAHTKGNSVLELCCGTGRIARGLAEQGLQVVGLDYSSSMLAQAQRFSSTVNWVEADMQDFHLGQRFATILFPMNCIYYLLERENLEKCLACVKEHLEPNGILIIDSFNTGSPDYYTDYLFKTDRQLFSIYSHPDGTGNVVVTYANDFDLVKQLNKFKLFFRLPGEKKDYLEEGLFRHYFPKELETLLYYNGFGIQERFGDYKKSPYTQASSNLIWLCHSL